MAEGTPNYADAKELEEQSQNEDSQADREQTKALPRLKHRSRRPNEEEQVRNLEFFQANPQHLITMDPNIEAYSLSTNEWSKLLATGLSGAAPF
jgi:hypothetical protein